MSTDDLKEADDYATPVQQRIGSKQSSVRGSKYM